MKCRPHWLIAFALLAACGARTSLEIPIDDGRADAGEEPVQPDAGEEPDAGPDAAVASPRCQLTPIGEPIVVFRAVGDARLELPQLSGRNHTIELAATRVSGDRFEVLRATFDRDLADRHDFVLAPDARSPARVITSADRVVACYAIDEGIAIVWYGDDDFPTMRVDVPELSDCRALGHRWPGVRVIGEGRGAMAGAPVFVDVQSDGTITGGPEMLAPRGAFLAVTATLGTPPPTTAWGLGAPGSTGMHFTIENEHGTYEDDVSDLALAAVPPALTQLPSSRGIFGLLVAPDPSGELAAIRVSTSGGADPRYATGIRDYAPDLVPAVDTVWGFAAIAARTSETDGEAVHLAVLDLQDETPTAHLMIAAAREPEHRYGGVAVHIEIPMWQGYVHWDEWIAPTDPSAPGEHVTRVLSFVCEP